VTVDLHHAVPRCTLRLLERAEGGDVLARVSFEDEALRWGVDVTISREALAELVEASTVILDREAHKLGHGSSWMAALALRRWGRITRADLDAARVVR
jgi:hypothetical protein